MILRVIWRYMDPDGYLCRSVITKRMPYHQSSRSLDTARLQRDPIALKFDRRRDKTHISQVSINLTKQDFHASYWPGIVVGCVELLATLWQTLLSMPLLHGPFCKEIFWSVFHFKQLSGFVICIYIYMYVVTAYATHLYTFLHKTLHPWWCTSVSLNESPGCLNAAYFKLRRS